MDKDGYAAVQIAFGTRKAKNVSKAARGHVRAAGLEDTPPARLREIRLDADPETSVGDTLTVALFEPDDIIDVVATTKGRGFQGVVKRWRFAGGRASHGGGWTRRPGAIGMCVNPGKVYKGRKMPGQMGGDQRTVQNLRIVAVRADDNLLLIKGSIPGPNGGFVLIRSALKQ